MTEKLYEVDSYVQKFTAQVVSCTPVPGGFAVVLDRTAFFPEGGGQPCDTGRLGGARVLAVHTDGETITHTTDAPLTAGETVDGCLDWPARLDAMQQHTGEHILSGALHRLFGAENVGFHIGSPYVRMDTSIPLTQEQLAQAEAEANAAVRADTPVHCWVPDPETLARTDYRSKKELTGDVRIVTFPGVDICACCGTHVTRTGEIGLVKIFSCEKFHEGVRLELLCGRRALEYLSAALDQNRRVSGQLSAKPLETAEAVRRALDELAQQKARAAALETRVFEAQAESLRGHGNVLLFEDGLTPDALRRLGDAVMTRCGGRCAVFSGSDAEGYKYCVAEDGGDLRQLTKEMNAALHGRGGGKPFFVQGSVSASRREIETFFETEDRK